MSVKVVLTSLVLGLGAAVPAAAGSSSFLPVTAAVIAPLMGAPVQEEVCALSVTPQDAIVTMAAPAVSGRCDRLNGALADAVAEVVVLSETPGIIQF